ncbi:hypothetical protein WR25_19587 [Diploscapter pachys]|uniref:EF-hand domain-containing protein n=1 Tax=Diploscapter pachys TaxID=2018661 RepID=A0A2A2LC88_9BILA|nr:hypothetical protein WR25_19587 [Diploscapter pachys]
MNSSICISALNRSKQIFKSVVFVTNLQTCPNGYVNRQQFCQIYRSFFAISPKTDAKPYANMIFDTLDDDGNGRISFSEFANELSMFIKGDVEQRIDWIFNLYDSKRRGYLMEEDFLRVFRPSIRKVMEKYLVETSSSLA